MAEERDIQEVTRTRRVEVVDAQGRPQLVLGDLSGENEPETRHGITVLGKTGTERAWLAVDEESVHLAFDRGGNAVLEVSVEDGTGESVVRGLIVQISDAKGRPVVGLHVGDDGALVLRGGEAA